MSQFFEHFHVAFLLTRSYTLQSTFFLLFINTGQTKFVDCKIKTWTVKYFTVHAFLLFINSGQTKFVDCKVKTWTVKNSYFPVCKVAVFFPACREENLLLYTLGSMYFYSKNKLFNSIFIILDTI